MAGLRGKMKESFFSVLPIIGIVAALCFSVVPITNDQMLSFLIGAQLLVLGLGMFEFGAESSMTKIGTQIGSKLTKSRKLVLILPISFALGLIITIAEPDLSVLSQNVPHIETRVLIITVAVGVGFFLVAAMLRILFAIPLKWMLLVSYAVLFGLAFISDPDYLSVAFDAGGVTTGPMTAPFIMAMGIGVASIRSDQNAEADSFGLVALCSVGPILAVLLLGFFYPGESFEIAAGIARAYATTVELSRDYLTAIPHYMGEVAMSLLPVMAAFLIFQLTLLKLNRVSVARIMIGFAFTYAGLVIFMTGVNVGFSSLGMTLGQTIAGSAYSMMLIPLGGVIGWFIVAAEPAVQVLTKQVEEISAGAVSSKAMKLALSAAIALATGISMLRVLTGLPILYLLVPGYFISLALSFVVPPIFTAIAFDAGGVASGPMTATFLLPLAMGACATVGGNLLTDAFGVVAMVAMFPLITVQLMGVVYVIRLRAQEKQRQKLAALGDQQQVIELWDI